MIGEVGGIPYSTFVAPGLLAASCMNGAISDGFFNIFFKLYYKRTYDGILATPMRVPDIAFGEMLWALTRGSIYAAAFLLVVLLMGQTIGPRMLPSAWAILALPGSVLVSATFAAIALCITSFVRRVEDFDIVMGLLVMPMFLFSGTFFPVTQLPGFRTMVGPGRPALSRSRAAQAADDRPGCAGRRGPRRLPVVESAPWLS